MYKVEIRDESYNRIEFAFDGMIEAAGFMNTCLKKALCNDLQCIVTQITSETIPDDFEPLEIEVEKEDVYM